MTRSTCSSRHQWGMGTPTPDDFPGYVFPNEFSITGAGPGEASLASLKHSTSWDANPSDAALFMDQTPHAQGSIHHGDPLPCVSAISGF